MPSVALEADVERALRKLGFVSSRVFDRALPRATRKVATQGRNVAVRKMRDSVSVKVSALKRLVIVRRGRSDPRDAVIVARGAVIPFAALSPREIKAGGVSVRIGGRRQVFRQAFMVDLAGGEFGLSNRERRLRNPAARTTRKVMQRGRYRGGRFVPSQSRLPINELYTGTVPGLFGAARPQRAARAIIRRRLRDVLRREIQAAQGRFR